MAAMNILRLPSQDAILKHIDSASLIQVKRKRSGRDLPERLFQMAVLNPPKLGFDPAKHLKYRAPEKIWSMEEIGLAMTGISPNAVSEPFELFTEDAIKQMRAEILSEDVLLNCQYKSNLAHCQLRGMAPE